MTFEGNPRSSQCKSMGDARTHIFVASHAIKKDCCAAFGGPLDHLFSSIECDQKAEEEQTDNHPLYNKEKEDYEKMRKD